jgi:Tat protein translocase TatB subunit
VREVPVFGIGMQEIVLICAIALIVVGPRRLPEIAKALGKGYGEFRRAFDEMKRNVETDIHAEEIRRSLLDLPPPPPPPAAQPPAQPESLLVERPAPGAGDTPPLYPYPDLLDGSAPPPERHEQSEPPRTPDAGPARRHDG